MKRISRMNEWTIEGFFGRKAPATEDTLDEISWFVRNVHEAHPKTTVDEGTASFHVSAMLDAARLSADNGDPVARPVSKAHGPAPQVSGLPKLRRKPVLSNLFATLAAKIAVGTVASLTGVSAMAAAGVLPDPAQSAAAKVASVLGINLEDPNEVPVILGDDDEFAKTEEDDLELEDVDDDPDLDGDDTGTDDAAGDTAGDTGTGDTAGTEDTAPTAETVETVDTAETADTASAPSAASDDQAEEEREEAEDRAEEDREIAKDRGEEDRELADDRAEEDLEDDLSEDDE